MADTAASGHGGSSLPAVIAAKPRAAQAFSHPMRRMPRWSSAIGAMPGRAAKVSTGWNR